MKDQPSENAFTEFYTEAEEILQRVSNYLTQVEQTNKAETVIDPLYRDIHTLKGSSQLFGLVQIGQVAHAMEASLEPIRSKKISFNKELIDLLFQSLDLIDTIVKSKTTDPAQSPVKKSQLEEVTCKLIDAVARSNSADTSNLRSELISLAEKKGPTPPPPTPEKVEPPPIRELKLAKEETSTTNNESMVKPMTTATTEVKKSPAPTPTPTPTPTASPAKEDSAANIENSSIRVQVSLLDKLMNLVGELVLVRNQVLQFSQAKEDFTFLNLSQKLDLVTAELQDEVMKTRMQPIGNVVSKFNRVVRDLARDLGKQIEFSVEGSETELDKTLLEAIKDPLTHIIRNSCDHGIETIEERKAAGKNPTGHILIKSHQESGQVVIEIRDDGKGINSPRVLEKAIEKGLVTAEKAKTLSEKEIQQMIFMPGFSTAQQVSAVSGRGVGMDVVRTNIEKVGGTIDLQSVYKKGTTLRLKIPLTLAIVPALIVRHGSESFSIPQVKLQELVRIEKNNEESNLELLQGRPVLRLRGSLLPILSMQEILSTEMMTKQYYQSLLNIDDLNIAILSNETNRFGLIIEEVLDTADIVVKPVPNYFKKLQIYSGATIMGDGSVALILDIAGVAAKGKIQDQINAQKHNLSANAATAVGKKYSLDEQEFLSFTLSTTGSFSVPLCLVQRLEEFPRNEIEISGNQRVVQYRNSILPIISLNEILNLKPVASKSSLDRVAVLVVNKRNRIYGIEVDQIEDIITGHSEVEESVVYRPGIVGSIIMGEEVYTVVDIYEVLDIYTGEYDPKTRRSKKQESEPGHKKLKILLAEDTPFFVKQIKKILSTRDYEVTHAADGEIAYQKLEAAAASDYDVILSDIEMPNMNGFELAEKVRASSKWSKIPMIAITTRFRNADIELGKKVGFSDYLEKLKGDELLLTLDKMAGGK